MTIIISGGQFGDEGKGKIVSYLARTLDLKAIARAGTGPNAGHTVVHAGVEYKLRLVPSGFFNKNAKLYIGAGVLVHPPTLLEEIQRTGVEDRIFVDHQTGIIEEQHILRDRKDTHLKDVIGSTGSGCGPANEDRARRILKLARDIDSLKPYLTDVSAELNEIIDSGGEVLIEGSQATHLSLIHGTYPFVTSKDVTASTFAADVGIGPTKVDEVIVVFKAFTTRVGTGPLNGELSEDEIRKRGWVEYGTVTGRPRRAAPFDFSLARKSVQLNGATTLALTKMDIVFPEMAGKISEKDITRGAMEFIEKVEDVAKVPVKYVSTGPGSEHLIVRDI
ncbi:MAG: adenylosuccinate synthetase [Methanobacteriota archaeon]|nr:MAG: adenylosuccinate synthetase [Euryarchaeota archaeon]